MADYATLGNKLLKVLYDKDVLRSIIAEQFQLEQLFPKWTEPPKGEIGGQKWVFGVLTKWPTSVGFQSYDGYVRTPDSFDMVVGEVGVKQLTASGRIELAIWKLSEGQPRAFANALETEKEALVKRIRDRRIKAYLGGADGVAAYASGANGNRVNVVSPLGYPDEVSTVPAGVVFRPGDRIVFYNPSSGYVPTGASAKHYTVLDVEEDTITLNATPPTIPETGLQVFFGEYSPQYGYLSDRNQALDGLRDLLAKEIYEGIDSNNVPLWRPVILDNQGTLRPLSADIINAALTAAEVRGVTVDTLLANTKAKLAFYNLFADLVRFQPGEFKGGMSNVSWDLLGHKLTLWFDPQVPDTCLLIFRSGDLIRFVLDEGGWLDQDGSELKWVRDKTAFVFVWAEFRNIGTKFRNHFIAVTDLQFVS